MDLTPRWLPRVEMAAELLQVEGLALALEEWSAMLLLEWTLERSPECYQEALDAGGR